MSEKLPPKPSRKGNDWAIDASNCQACNAAFTFIHRKHHCRRCGGIFCGNCTQQRINLRGQGEGPVRICDTCKKLEDAARLELRSGQRHRVSKGASKPDLSSDSAPLSKEIAGLDPTNKNVKSVHLMDEVSDAIDEPKHTGSMSLAEAIKAGNDESLSTQVTPEMLLLQAQEEKKQWLLLKREGKGNEALQAFKRSKELERKAESLKLFLRRSERNAVASSVRKGRHEKTNKMELKERIRSLGSEDEIRTRKITRPPKEKKNSSVKEKEKTDDMLTALKELGWNDADLLDTEGKQNKARTVESELAELAAAADHGNENNQRKMISSMEVLAHKRKALALKREGKLAEAKEELKTAKLLERQLEEQQMLGSEAEESDDDLRALMSEITKGGADHNKDTDMDFSLFTNIQEDDDQLSDANDADMDDPEMLAALKLMGWEEDSVEVEKTSPRAIAKPRNTGHLLREGERSAGGIGCLEGYEGVLDGAEANENHMKVPYFLSTIKDMRFEEEDTTKLAQPVLPSIEDKQRLQQEVLLLKKEALALKRTGKLQEAKDELRQSKQLERQLHEMKSCYNDEDILDAFSVPRHQPLPSADSEAIFSDEDHEENVDVTEDDMQDPDLAKTLESLGWTDDHENDENLTKEIEPSEEAFRASHHAKNKSELQKDLLGIKRAALKLRREGKVEEAEEELKKALIIEQLMEDLGRISAIKKERLIEQEPETGDFHFEQNINVNPGEQVNLISYLSDLNEATTLPTSGTQSATPTSEKNTPAEEVFSNTPKESSLKIGGQHFQDLKVSPDQGPSSLPVPKLKAQTVECSKVADTSAPLKSRSTALSPPVQTSQQQILILKREALALKRKGRQLEAKEKLKEAKMLEKMLAADSATSTVDQAQKPVEHHETVPPPEISLGPPTTSAAALSKPPLDMTNRPVHKSAGKDRMKLQQESLAHKRKALALRREGKPEEADMEFELAKSIEKKMEDLGSIEGHPTMPQGDDLGSVEDLIDPQLLAALKGLGWKDCDIHENSPELRPEIPQKIQEVTRSSKASGAPTITGTSGLLQSNEKQQLEQKIKSEKIRALNLKKSGQQKEALEVLRGAKLLERQLQ